MHVSFIIFSDAHSQTRADVGHRGFLSWLWLRAFGSPSPPVSQNEAAALHTEDAEIVLGDAMRRLSVLDVSRACTTAKELRRSLRQVFGCLSASPFVDVSTLDLSLFCTSKDLHLKQPLLWTSQVESLWHELVVEPDSFSFRGQILAGPSGIGKSHIAFLLALRCYASGMPVLYLADAGEHFSAHSKNGSSCAKNDAPLCASFKMLNADILLPEAMSYVISYDSTAVPYDHSFMQLLHKAKAVVILDEHGHAFNKLEKADLDPSVTFPLLMPNSYLNKHNIRCVFAGSNQAQFEAKLNGTYRRYLRFITPLNEKDADLFWGQLGAPPTVKDFARWTNAVPREMVRLAAVQDAGKYVTERRHEIFSSLVAMEARLDRASLSYAIMISTLDSFFRASSMAFGSEHYSFLDLGYVYRIDSKTALMKAVPLCYPAALALMDLWRIVSPAASIRLESARKSGNDFEDLVWDVLLARSFLPDGCKLLCKPLGSNPTVEPITIISDEFFVSSIIYNASKQSKVNAELKKLLERCVKSQITMLYRCPVGCAGVDFFVLRGDGTCTAIQTSISKLTDHDTANSLIAIPSIFGQKILRYIYITVAPEEHAILATNPALAHVRIVSADEWFVI